MRAAIARGEFGIYYQPLVQLATAQIRGVEALVRWIHPTRGLLLPSDFMPGVEESMLIQPLGEWVLRTACRQVRAWQAARQDATPLSLSVNLAKGQLRAPGLASMIRRVLDETGFDPRCLKLDIAERTASEQMAAISADLDALRRDGVRIVLHDFGAGSSALTDLTRLPIDALKVDRSYIEELGADPCRLAVVQAAIAFARAMNLEVSAVGVETADQLDRLRALGIERGQGFLFAAPLDAEAAGRLLTAGASVTAAAMLAPAIELSPE